MSNFVKNKSVNEKLLNKIIAKHKDKPGEILGILEEIQNLNPHKYLPQAVLSCISKKTKISLTQIYGVVTFYSFFNLKPQGKHAITVCRGTACYTRGSKDILEALKVLLGLAGDLNKDEHDPITTKDNKFTIRTVACFGQCALAPVIEINGKIYSQMTREKLRKLIQAIKKRK